MNGPKRRCNANDYLNVLDTLEARFKEQAFTVHSFPELSLEAWLYKDPEEIPNRKWKTEVYARIQEYCRENKSPEFSRQDFLTRYFEYFQELFPKTTLLNILLHEICRFLGTKAKLNSWRKDFID